MKGRGRGGQIDPPAPEKTTLEKPSLIRVKTKRPKPYNTEVSFMIKRPKSLTQKFYISNLVSYYGKLILKCIVNIMIANGKFIIRNLVL